MSDDDLHLAGVLGELVRLGFRRAALTLLRERGGISVYVPADPQTGQPLVDLIGMDAARALAGLYGGDHVEIASRNAMATAKQRILRDVAAGASGTNALALKHGVSSRHVRAVVENARPDPRQLDMLEMFERT